MPKPLKYDDRKSSSERGYGYKWQKARDAYMRKHPLCVEHERRGVVELGTVIDHITPHKGDMKLFWDSSNWHNRFTQISL